MLQRKQTLFLIASIALIVFTLLNHFVSTTVIFFSAFKLNFTDTGIEKTISSYPIAIFLIVLAVIHLFSVFLYKSRIVQMRFVIFSMILSVGFYGLLLFYHFMVAEVVDIKFSQYHFSLVSPLLAAVFDFLALNGIRGDEKIVRDSERFR